MAENEEVVELEDEEEAEYVYNRKTKLKKGERRQAIITFLICAVFLILFLAVAYFIQQI